ncbi:hypothetical protein GCM10010335_38540 [Streptomyces galbus]|nr:hypothetical protein GCM10010335_38540 [Streptomyces galbus]
MNRFAPRREGLVGGAGSGAGRAAGRRSRGRAGGENGCESTPSSVLMFCVSEGAGPKGTEPEDTPNARVAE